MSSLYPNSGLSSNTFFPQTGLSFRYPSFMDNYKKILWENLRLLMRRNYGKENLAKCAKEAKIGHGTVARIKEQQTSTGLDVIEQLAELFKVKPYEMLMPNLGQEGYVISDFSTDPIVDVLNSLPPKKANYYRALIQLEVSETRQPSQEISYKGEYKPPLLPEQLNISQEKRFSNEGDRRKRADKKKEQKK